MLAIKGAAWGLAVGLILFIILLDKQRAAQVREQVTSGIGDKE